MPVSGDVKSLYYDSYALQSNMFHEIIQDLSILSINVTANSNKVSLTNLIRDGLYRKAGLVQHFTFICTSFQASAAWNEVTKFHPHNVELRLQWNIKSKICYFTVIRLLSVFVIDSKLYWNKKNLTFSLFYFSSLRNCLCVCVCVFVCVCVCVCVCISVHRKGFSWLNRTMDVLPDIQASDVVLRKLFRVKNLCLHIIDNHSRTF